MASSIASSSSIASIASSSIASATTTPHPSTIFSVAPSTNNTFVVSLPHDKIPYSLHDGPLTTPPSSAEIAAILTTVANLANEKQFIKADPDNKHGKTSLIFGSSGEDPLEKEMNRVASEVMAAIDALHDRFLEDKLVTRDPAIPGSSSLKRSRMLTDTIFLDDGIGAEYHLSSGTLTFSDNGANLDVSSKPAPTPPVRNLR